MAPKLPPKDIGVRKTFTRTSTFDMSLLSPTTTSSLPPLTPNQQNPLPSVTRIPISQQKPRLPRSSTTKQQRTARKWRIRLHLNWWWEFGGVLLSIVCTTLMAAILFYTSNRPLSEWKLPIQPNSLISVFSTIAKSALLVPVSECISQLKWIYFEKPRTLDKMQVFDDASRGPWGALVFLRKARVTIGSVGAVITIFALAFEPFAQQVLEFPSRESPLRGSGGTIASANSWSDAALVQNADYSVRLSYNFGLLSKLAGRPSLSPVSYCPTSSCTFPNFTSLAISSTCESSLVSEEVGNLEIGYSSTDRNRSDAEPLGALEGATWNWTNYDNRSSFSEAWDKHGDEFGFMSVGVSVAKPGYQTLDFNVTGVSQYSGPRNSSITIRATDAIVGSLRGLAFGNSLYGKKLPLVQRAGDAVDRITKGGSQIFQLCTRQRNSAHLDLTDIERYTCISMHPDYTGLKDQNDVVAKMPIKANMTWCRVHFTARRFEGVSIRNNTVQIKRSSDVPLKWIHSEGGDDIFGTESFPETFSIGNKSKEAFSFVLHNTTDAYVDSILPAVETQGWENFFGSVGATFSDLLRTDSNAALANMDGQTYGMVTFVRVRWGWFVMPLVIVVLSIIFFGMTVLESHGKEHLFKSSILAPLFHGLEGWHQDDLRIQNKLERERARALMHRAESMRVRLIHNGKGDLRFMRED